ncbi:MAG TPA: glyoxalase superfamily protein [Victivallales bacterium]|nr:glyoxalase superfamily protein [Victivallales bacterium]
MTTKIRFNHIAPHFVVKDVEASISFYKNLLGFEVDYEKGSPIAYAVVCRDEVYIHLCLQKTQNFKIGPGCCFISVSNVNSLWNRVNSYKINIIEPLKENDYGYGACFKDFKIKDADNNVLRIGEPIRLLC